MKDRIEDVAALDVPSNQSLFISRREVRDYAQQELEKGEITPDLVEVLKIATPEGADRYDTNTPEQEIFDAYVQGIVNRLMGSEFAQKNILRGQSIPSFRSYILDDKRTENAGIFMQAKPPFLAFTRALLKKVADEGKEDYLAAIVSHELTHYLINSEKNTKIEEGVAYALPRFLLYFSGYQHNATSEFFEKLRGRYNVGQFFAYFDVHPSPTLTDRIIADSEGFLAQYLRRRHKGFKSIPMSPPTDMPEAVKRVIPKFTYHDIIEEDFEKNGFRTHPYDGEGDEYKFETIEKTKGKIEFIAQNLDKWLDIKEATLGPLGRYERVEQIENILDSHLGRHSEANVDLKDVSPLINTIVGLNLPISLGILTARSPRINPLRNTDYFVLRGADIHPPEGSVFKKIEASFREVFQLMTKRGGLNMSEASEKCQKLKEDLMSIPAEQRYALSHYYFGEVPGLPGLHYNSGKVFDIWKARWEARKRGVMGSDGIVPPWDGLIHAALREYKTRKETHIADVLLILGITDPRMDNLPCENPLISNFAQHFTYMDLGFPIIMQDSQGRIIGSFRAWKDYLESSLYETKDLGFRRSVFYEGERDNIIELMTMEKYILEKLSNINHPEELYELMAKYPINFVFPNRFLGASWEGKDQLPNYKFNREFISFLEARAREDPRAWIPFIRDIFTVRHPTYEYEDLHQRPETLHDLCRRVRYKWLDNIFSGGHDYFLGEYNRERGESEHVKIYLPEEIGMPHTHPYVEFILGYTEGFTEDVNVIFSRSEALSVLDRLVTVKVLTFKGEEISPPQILARDIYLKLIGEAGYPDTEQDLRNRLYNLRNLTPSVDWLQEHGKPPAVGEWSSRFLLIQARHEVYQWLINHNDTKLSAETFEEILLLINSKVGVKSYSEVISGDAYASEMEQLLENQFLINADKDLKGEETNALQIAKSFRLFERNGYFREHPELLWDSGYNQLVINKLSDLIKSSDTPVLREFCETILYGCFVQSPEVREKLISSWAESLKLVYGIDNSPAFSDPSSVVVEESRYQAEILQVVNQVTENVIPNSFYHEEMLEKLTESLQTQSYLTRSIFTLMHKKTESQLRQESEGFRGTLGELGLNFFTSDDDLRPATIDFLLTHLSENSLNQFIETIDIRVDAIKKRYRSTGVHLISQAELYLLFNRTDIFDVKLVNPEIRAPLKSRLRSLHENFWQAKLGVRAYYMSMIAFPSNLVQAKDRVIMETLSENVLNTVLPYIPDESRDSRMNRYTSFGRDLIFSYLKDATEAERRLLLSGLMVSARALGSVKDRTETTIGRALALTLLNMGPAGVKLAQAIHSYPDTPNEIREGMTGVKGAANIPARLQLIERIEEVVPFFNGNSDRLSLDRVSHIGEILGGGAYQATSRVLLNKALKDHDEIALTLLREHVYTYAQNEYEHILDTLKVFVERRREAGDRVKNSTLDALHQVVRQAKAMSTLETDYQIGAQQAKLISPQYQGLSVQANGKIVAFTTVDWLDHGTETVPKEGGEDIRAYIALGIAPGKPFNHFVRTATADELKSLGMAMQVSEDVMMLSGKHFDHDRHGDNFNVYRIEKEIQYGDTMLKAGDLLVTHYDLGTVNIEPPSSLEKEEMGRIIASAVIATLSGSGDVKSAVIKELTQHLGSRSEPSDYLASVLRGFLARGDFLRGVDSKDIKNAVIALFQTGLIDPEIMSVTAKTLMNSKDIDFATAMSFMGSESPTVQVKTIPEVFK